MLAKSDGGNEDLSRLDLTPVDVDVDGLDDFRTLMGRELDANLRPGATGIIRDHGLGVGFGVSNVGRRVQAARHKYHSSLVGSTANLAAYITAAEILIDAIHKVAAKYRDSDATSAAGAAALNTELAAAFTAWSTAQQEESQRLHNQETRRELNRLHLRADNE